MNQAYIEFLKGMTGEEMVITILGSMKRYRGKILSFEQGNQVRVELIQNLESLAVPWRSEISWYRINDLQFNHPAIYAFKRMQTA